MSLTHIETIELGSSQSSITFSSIPQDYDDLILKVSSRTTNNSSSAVILMKLNGATANRTGAELGGSGSSAFTASRTDGRIALTSGNATTSNTFGSASIYFSNYTGSQAKSVSAEGAGENNATAALMDIMAFLWNDSSAITSIELDGEFGDFMTGTTASLYGVTAGGSGTVTTA